MQNEAVLYFAKFIEKELGIIYSDFNYFQLQNRLDEIVKMRSLKDSNELLRIAQQSMTSDLKQLILDVATNNETSFFRDPKLFQSLKTNLLPQILNKGKSSLRVWSAACSYGQEPYTISMLLKEYLEQTNTSMDIKILATDISSRVLEKAQKATYSQLEVQRGLPANLLIKYFEKDSSDYWTLKSPIKSNVSFQKLNLLDSFDSLGQFDLVFCRNVLIYQDVENKKKIIKKITSCMNKESFLILGAGESMIGLSDDFETYKIGDVIIYQLKGQKQKVA